MIAGSRESESYAITVRGHLDHHWGAWSGCVDLVCRDDGTTTLLTDAVDQARLHGILTRLRDMGVVLVAVVEWETAEDGRLSARRRARGRWRS